MILYLLSYLRGSGFAIFSLSSDLLQPEEIFAFSGSNLVKLKNSSVVDGMFWKSYIYFLLKEGAIVKSNSLKWGILNFNLSADMIFAGDSSSFYMVKYSKLFKVRETFDTGKDKHKTVKRSSETFSEIKFLDFGSFYGISMGLRMSMLLMSLEVICFTGAGMYLKVVILRV